MQVNGDFYVIDSDGKPSAAAPKAAEAPKQQAAAPEAPKAAPV
mgnify:CR=1 FL=1